MEVERAYAVGGSSVNTVKPTLDDFLRWKNEQRDANRSNGLLPPIPAGVAIDRGPDTSTTSYTTVGKPTFAYDGKGYAFAPFPITWVSSAPDTVQEAVSRPVHIGVSTSNLGGYPYPSTIGSAKLHDVYRQYLGGLLLVRTSDRSYL
jgi:hypothetical protein